MHSRSLLLFCLMYSGMAQAETIHRCADQNGKMSYSATPCPAGAFTMKTLETKIPPATSPVANAEPAAKALLPEYKQQELEFQKRQKDRLGREREEEAERARIKANEDEQRRQQTQAEAEQREQGRKASIKRRARERQEAEWNARARAR